MFYLALHSYTRNYSLTSTVLMAAIGSSIGVIAAGAIPTWGFSALNTLQCSVAMLAHV